MRRRLRAALARLTSKLARGLLTDPRFFELYQSEGYHVTPVHFYYPLPDTRELSEGLWTRRSDLVGLRLNEPDQIAWLQSLPAHLGQECGSLETDVRGLSLDGAFGPVDAEVLYCMIRRLRPRRILEVGSGMSSLIMAHAVERNAAEDGRRCELVAIDPFSAERLPRPPSAISRVRSERLQEVPLSEFEALGENDILFIDSSHVVHVGSDVNHAILEILPRLRPGVIVHVHDIFLPAEYPRDWVLERHAFWNEQYLVHAFLAFNPAFTVLWAAHFMHLEHPERLAAAFRTYRPGQSRPASLWLRRGE